MKVAQQQPFQRTTVSYFLQKNTKQESTAAICTSCNQNLKDG
jgi:hypothetical protein